MKILKKSILLLATVVAAAAAASGNIDKALPNNDVDKVDDDHQNKLRVSSTSEKGIVDVEEKGDIAITPLNSSGKLRALHLNDDDEDDFGLGQRIAKRGKRSKQIVLQMMMMISALSILSWVNTFILKVAMVCRLTWIYHAKKMRNIASTMRSR